MLEVIVPLVFGGCAVCLGLSLLGVLRGPVPGWLKERRRLFKPSEHDISEEMAELLAIIVGVVALAVGSLLIALSLVSLSSPTT